MIFKNINGQGVYFIATDISGYRYPGDATNISGKYSLDGNTTLVYFADDSPSEIGLGVYWQPLSQSETNGNSFTYIWESTTPGVEIYPAIGFTQAGAVPFAVAGANGGLPLVDASGWVQSDIRAIVGSGVELSNDLLNVNVSGWGGETPRNLDVNGNVYASVTGVTATVDPNDLINLGVNVTGWLGVEPLALSNQYVQSVISNPINVNVTGWNGAAIRNPDGNGNIYMVSDLPISANITGWLGEAVKAMDANQNLYVIMATSGIGHDSFSRETELSAVPSAPYNPIDILLWMGARSLHLNVVTSGLDTIYKSDGTTVLATGVLNETSTTFTRNQYD